MKGRVATLFTLLLAGAATLPGAPPPASPAALPARPEQLRFPPLELALPDPAALRHVLGNGVVVYIAPDHGLPLVEVSVLARIGSFLDPPGKPGLAVLTADLMRNGGTRAESADDFDDAATAIAADLGVTSGDTTSAATLSVLSSHVREGLDLLFGMVARPTFTAKQVASEKASLRAAMAGRFDAPADLLEREWQWLLLGRGPTAAHFLTPRRLAALGRRDLAAFHSHFWRPENVVLVVAGDVVPAEILALLEGRFGRWKGSAAKRSIHWPPPPPLSPSAPGLYSADLEAPQTQVALGYPGLAWAGHWDDPERYAVELLNEVLGGNLFTSRLGRKLRGEEGLVYGVGSQSGLGELWPDALRVTFATAPDQAARAAALALEEIRRLQAEPVTADELSVGKSALLTRIAQRFGSPRESAATFASDELLGRPHERWSAARARVLALTAAEVQAAARRLGSAPPTILVVGPWAKTAADPALARLPGPPRPLPRRDPVTLEP